MIIGENIVADVANEGVNHIISLTRRNLLLFKTNVRYMNQLKYPEASTFALGQHFLKIIQDNPKEVAYELLIKNLLESFQSRQMEIRKEQLLFTSSLGGSYIQAFELMKKNKIHHLIIPKLSCMPLISCAKYQGMQVTFYDDGNEENITSLMKMIESGE